MISSSVHVVERFTTVRVPNVSVTVSRLRSRSSFWLRDRRFTAEIIFRHQGNGENTDTIATVRQSAAKAYRVENATARRTVIGTVNVKTTASSTLERRPMSWPAGFDGYTIALASERLRSDALGAASKASAAGLGDVGVDWSSDYSSLRPGYWFVWSGVYTTAGEAEADVAQAEDAGFAGAYVRRVAR